MPRLAVRKTEDFDRVCSLPRRTITRADAEAAARELTPILKMPRANVSLLPWQGAALAEARRLRLEDHPGMGGMLLGYPVGTGKTMIYELLPHPEILDAKRAVLILPAGLRGKTNADRRSYLGRWQLPARCPTIITREELALESRRDLLNRLAPTLIMIDEADTLSNHKSAAARRIERYLGTDAGASCRVVVGTGTLSRKSILGYWHMLRWCLREGAPVPLARSEATMWAAAIDHKPPKGTGMRPLPGAMGSSVSSARAWYRERLAQTDGVILVDEDSAGDVPLTIETTWAPEDPILNDVFEQFLTKFEVPGGDVITDPLSRWRLDRWLGSGLHEPYVVPPPEVWRIAQRTFAGFVRDTIDHPPRRGHVCDTAGEVVRWYPDAFEVTDWFDIKDTFAGVTRTDWLSDSVLKWCAEWIKSRPLPSTVWCGVVEFAERLAQVTDLPYYGAKGKTMNTMAPGLYAADPKRSLIASWNAGLRGYNMQPWEEHLGVQPPQSAKDLEQLIGRAHRQGRKTPVKWTILLTSGGTADSFEETIGEASFARDTASHTQKILRAEIIRAGDPPSAAMRWARRPKQSER